MAPMMQTLVLFSLLLQVCKGDFVGHTSKSSGKSIRILAIGDSLTEGMVSDKSSFHPYAEELVNLAQQNKVSNFEVVEEGVSGEAVVPSMAERLIQLLGFSDAQGKPYTHIFINGGLNDMNFGRKAEDIFMGLLHMFQEGEKHGAHVVAMTIMEFSLKSPSLQNHNAIRTELNELIRQHCQTYHQGHGAEQPGKLSLVDLEKLITPEMVPDDLSQGKSYFTDVVHLTAYGYRYMAKQLWDHILKPELMGTASV